jgi:hypothetical protein
MAIAPSRTPLQARKVRSDGADPIVADEGGVAPERELLLADAIGLAPQIVLETLPPAERLVSAAAEVTRP